MVNPERYGGYLPPRDQYATSLKINRLCDSIDKNTFNPAAQIADAQAIVDALHSKIKPRSKVSVGGGISYPSSGDIRGATDIGEVRMSTEERKIKKVQLGINEYRIGEYVATKYEEKDRATMVFEHFWDRGAVNEIFEAYAKRTVIEYDNESLKIREISFLTPLRKSVKFLFISLNMITYQKTSVWKKSQDSPKI
jgi:hypothetical protein